MKILGYDEVDDQQVLELNMVSFRWMLTPEHVKKIKKEDARCPHYFALYAVEKEKVLSQVGFITLNTQTSSGVERVGYIWGVCTHPKAARRGLAGELIKEAHARMAEDDIRYSFLGTGKSLVAYSLYRKMGYMDFMDFNSGIKTCTPKTQAKTEVTYTSRARNDTFVKLFEKYSKGLLGFIHRPKNFVQVRKTWTWMPLNTTGIFRRDGKTMGYLLANKEGKILKILEVCCPRIEDIQECIAALEMKFKPQYMTFDWTARSHVVNKFVVSGFTHFNRTWGVFMVKDLKEKHTIGQIRESYGREDDRFQMTCIDEY